MITCPVVFGFMMRLHTVYCWVAPWQLSWGSPEHAFAQTLITQHSGFILLNVCLASIFASPLLPVVGSAVFLVSFPRLTRFWSNSTVKSQMDTDEQKYTVLEEDFETELKGLNLAKSEGKKDDDDDSDSESKDENEAPENSKISEWMERLKQGKKQQTNAVFYRLVLRKCSKAAENG